MPTPEKFSFRLTAPFILATVALSSLSLSCGSDDPGPPIGAAGTTSTPTSGSAGMATQAGSTSGGTAGGGTGTAGTATASGGTSGSSTGGSGGASAGSGGAPGPGPGPGGGAGGGSGGSGGGSAVSFVEIKTLLAATCAGNMCHSAASSQADWVTSDGLYMRLTTPLPDSTPHCVGNTAVVPNMPAQSLLLQTVKGPTTCNKKGGGMEQIARMPDHCGETGRSPCLTETQIKLISDWISGGAPM